VANPQGTQRMCRRLALGLAGLLLFVLAIEWMKDGSAGLEWLVRGHLEVTNVADCMGLGWLLAYLVLSGSCWLRTRSLPFRLSP
jgi:sodium-dependent phosphate cotransporter